MSTGVQTPVRQREHRRRRAVVLGLALLIVLGMSPLFAHDIAAEFHRTLFTTDHFGAICLIALHYLMEPVHGLFHLLLIAGLLYATFDRLRAGVLLRRTLRDVTFRRADIEGEFAAAARLAGVDPGLLRIGSGLPIPAFTSGYFRPRIYLDAHLPEVLDRRGMASVIAHEAAHVESGDPLRMAALRFLSLVLFWIPGFGALVRDLNRESEIRADDRASAVGPAALATALVTLAEWPTMALRNLPVSPLHGSDLLARRIRRLMGEDVAPETELDRRFVTLASAVLFTVWLSGIVVAHPLPGHDLAHCNHVDTRPWSHLVCPERVAVQHCTTSIGA